MGKCNRNRKTGVSTEFKRRNDAKAPSDDDIEYDIQKDIYDVLGDYYDAMGDALGGDAPNRGNNSDKNEPSA